MVDFSGWHMPLQYEGILAEHAQVRGDQGIFDVSHMGEVDFLGPGAQDAVQHLITNDVGRLTDLTSLYTAVCLPSGGIVDDCIVYRLHDQHLRIVVNAANIEKDVAHFREHAGQRCDVQDRSEEFALLAVQGPNAVAAVVEACLARDVALDHAAADEREAAEREAAAHGRAEVAALGDGVVSLKGSLWSEDTGAMTECFTW